MSDKSKLEALTRMFMQELGGGQRARPHLHVVPEASIAAPPRREFDAVTRDAHFKRIRYLARAYRLRWLLDQETFHVAALECLEDAELSALLSDMERARECMQEDVSFEDAGLVRSRA